MNQIIKENKNYLLKVGSAINKEEVNCYQVINKITNVIEAEFFMLPQALVNFDKISELLEDYNTNHSNKDKDLPSLLKDTSKVTSLFKDKND